MLFLFCLSLYAIFCVRPRKAESLLKDLYQKNLLITGHFLNPNESLIPRLKGIFEEEGIPGEWVWLVEIESNFNHHAKSDQGAKGLFQFMPETARRFGLKVDRIDERLNPEKSARAAAKYLKFLYEKFGSWRLTLAAYNAGEGRIERLLSEHNTKRFDLIAFDLPAETRLYVPKVLNIVEAREGVDPTKLRPPKYA
jgi:membrane-bound lytic murein transglycosylase D